MSRLPIMMDSWWAFVMSHHQRHKFKENTIISDNYNTDDTYAAVILLDNDEYLYREMCSMSSHYDPDDEDSYEDLSQDMLNFARDNKIFEGTDIELEEVDFLQVAEHFLD